jgi:acetyl-CoA acyltransferase
VRIALRCAPGLIPRGVAAELIAAKWGFSRAQLDEFAASSHERAALAWKDGLFEREVVNVDELGTDETIRPTTPDSLAGLRLAFQDDR